MQRLHLQYKHCDHYKDATFPMSENFIEIESYSGIRSFLIVGQDEALSEGNSGVFVR